MSDYKIHIAGVFYRIPQKASQCGTFNGYVVPEPDNKYDPNAIKIVNEDGTIVGYVPRELTCEVKRLTNGERHSCTIELELQHDDEEFPFIDGTCYIHDVDLSRIDDKDNYDAPRYNLNLEDIEQYKDRTFLIYIDKPSDCIEIIGLDEALRIFSEIDEVINSYKDRIKIPDYHGNKSECKKIQLTLMLKHKHFWQLDKMVCHQDKVLLRVRDKESIEDEYLGVSSTRCVSIPNVPAYNESKGSSLFDALFGGSTPSGSDKSSKDSSRKSDEHYTIPKSKTDSIDWETKEKSWDSDEYTDFRW